jgi:serine/threonine protein kinase
MAKRHPWDERWESVKHLGAGGQGTTTLVKRRGGDDSVFVLKRLNRQNDPERRARMRREAVALQTLGHPGIPRYVDCNTQEYANDVPLFIVLEHIPGPTLEEFVADNAMALDDALAMAMVLTDILSYCHERNIGHRDIKPDNIILRNSSAREPVLIDFGQSFNLDTTAEPIGGTQTNEQMGNRFLILPEHRVPGDSKRDLRSDLTSCCGVLFYALTREMPTMLRDASGHAPHERDSVRSGFEALASTRRLALLRLFARGFLHRVDDRWQTAAELNEALSGVTQAASLPDQPVTEILATIARTREETERKRTAIDRLAEDAADILTAHVEPLRHYLLAQLEQRRATGLPIEVLSDSYSDDIPSVRDLVLTVASAPRESAAALFRVRSVDEALKSFSIDLEITFEPGRLPDGMVPVRFTLTFRHEAYKHEQDITYYFWRDGRLERAPGGLVDANDIARNILHWVDDRTTWSFPAAPD